MTGAVVEASERLLTLMREPVIPTVGIHENVPMDLYHSWAAIGSTGLKHLKRSPAHYRAYLEHGDDDTPARKLGRALHCAVLEPDDFPKRYLLAEQCEAIKKSDKKRCSNTGTIYSGSLGWLCGVHGSGAQSELGVTLLNPADFDCVTKMRDSIRAHRSARALLNGNGRRELSLVWIDEETGVLCKARPDHFAFDLAGGAIVDVKKTLDASKRAWERIVYKYSYQVQSAHYMAGAKANALPVEHFVHIPVEDELPYAVGTYRLVDGAMDAGEAERRTTLRLYAECIEKDEWPAYSELIEDAALPSYAFYEIDEDNSL